MESEKSLNMYFISWFHISRIVEHVSFFFSNLFKMGSKSETSLNYQKSFNEYITTSSKHTDVQMIYSYLSLLFIINESS